MIANRRAIISGLMILVLYVVGFFAVRYSYENGGSRFNPDPKGTGYLPPVEYRSTEFFAVRSAGLQRLWNYSLYYAFYPLGLVDTVLSGREYTLTDERNIIY
jgi:hypothetical protein